MKYFKNTSWLFAEKILRMVVGLFVGIWVARYLGPEQFGLFSYAQSFVGLFTAFATLGLDGIVVRELVKDKSRRDELIGSAFWLKLIGAFVVLIILAIAIHFTSNDSYTNYLVFIIASATIFQSFNVVDFYFQSKVLSKYVVYANVISLFITSLIKVTLILNEAPLIAFAWVVLFDSFVLAVGLMFLFLKNSTFRIWNLTFKRETAISLLKDSWPLIFGLIGVSIYSRIDQIMIKEMLDSEAVGYYSVAVRLTEMWLFITTALTTTFFPAIINAKKQDEALYLDRIQNLYNLLTRISVTLCILMMLFSDFIIQLLFGVDYIRSSEILNVYVWSLVFVFLSNGSWSYYLNENLVKLASIRLIYGAIANIILNIYLIKEVGVVGAAYSTLISYAIASYFFNSFYRKTRVIFKIQTMSFINIIKINKSNQIWR
mgnify:CR=1 FL=1